MNSENRIFFQCLDVACILTALAVSFMAMLPGKLDIYSEYIGASLITMAIFFLSFYMLDCYSVGKEDFRDSTIRVIVAVCIGIIATGFIFYSVQTWRFPRFMFIFQMLMTLLFCLGWRWIFFIVSKQFKSPEEKVIFLGAGMANRARRVLNEYMPEAHIIGYAGEQGADPKEAGPWLGDAAHVLAAVESYRATKVLVLDTYYIDAALAGDLFSAKLNGLKVEDMRSLYERLATRVPIDLIEDDWLLLADGFNLNVNGSLQRLKRAFDVCFALSLFILTSPLLLAAMALVALDSPGPVIYRQKRVGLHRQEFTLFKIRSMRLDAEKDGAVWAQKNDVRVTRIGRFIRKTRIDELPQLINVLKGDMSMVGPRPERMDFVLNLEKELPYYAVRHTVKPGITGWAQVSYPYGASLEDARYKLEYDLYYIKHLSVILEVKILLKTIGVVLFPRGAR